MYRPRSRPRSPLPLLAACCVCAEPGLVTAAGPPAAGTEGDDIAANLGRTDETEATKGLGFLAEFAASRKQWRERAGLEFGVTYHTFGTGALFGDGLPTAAAGDLTVEGIWTPGHAWRDHPLDLRFRLRQRHGFGQPAPSALGEELGTLWGVTDGFSDRGFEVPDFHLRQEFPLHGIELRYGQMCIDSQFDSHQLRGAKQSFLNQSFSSNPAVAFPRLGAGLTLVKNFGNGLDLTLGGTTVQGTRGGEQVDFNLDSDDLFQAIQLGYGFRTRNDRDCRLQVLLWHSDAVRSAGLPEGQGVSLTLEQDLEGKDLRAFARLAWSDGGAPPLDTLAAGGLAWQCGERDLFGLAAGCGRGSGAGHPVQAVFEAFYRWQPRAGLRITPDIQIIAGEDLADSPGLRLLAGIRTEFAF